ncbi:unnamed protein product [Boreogadus saida]
MISFAAVCASQKQWTHQPRTLHLHHCRTVAPLWRRSGREENLEGYGLKDAGGEEVCLEECPSVRSHKRTQFGHGPPAGRSDLNPDSPPTPPLRSRRYLVRPRWHAAVIFQALPGVGLRRHHLHKEESQLLI